MYKNYHKKTLNKRKSKMSRRNKWVDISPVDEKNIVVPQKGMKEEFKPRTFNQKNYVRNMVENEVVFCYGPAGSGKTCCAIGLACQYLYHGKVDRIILSRPLIQCGRNGGGLGFLKGDLNEKVSPFMEPVLDEIDFFLGVQERIRLINEKAIEIKPIELIKGKNFKNCFMICDEAENCEWEQLKTFATRICEGTKCVFSGDIKQTDVNHNNCAFKEMMERLEGVEGVAISELKIEDIQRSGVVGRILARLES